MHYMHIAHPTQCPCANICWCWLLHPFEMLTRSHIQSKLLNRHSKPFQCPSSNCWHLLINTATSFLKRFSNLHISHRSKKHCLPFVCSSWWVIFRYLKRKCSEKSCTHLVYTSVQVCAQFHLFWPNFLAQNMGHVGVMCMQQLPVSSRDPGRPYSDDNARKPDDTHRMSLLHTQCKWQKDPATTLFEFKCFAGLVSCSIPPSQKGQTLSDWSMKAEKLLGSSSVTYPVYPWIPIWSWCLVNVTSMYPLTPNHSLLW